MKNTINTIYYGKLNIIEDATICDEEILDVVYDKNNNSYEVRSLTNGTDIVALKMKNFFFYNRTKNGIVRKEFKDIAIKNYSAKKNTAKKEVAKKKENPMVHTYNSKFSLYKSKHNLVVNDDKKQYIHYTSVLIEKGDVVNGLTIREMQKLLKDYKLNGYTEVRYGEAIKW